MKRALPTPEVLAELVSALPDFDIEVVTVTLPTGRFEHLADTERAMRVASDLIEGAIQIAYGQGSVPPVEVWDEDCAERVSVSVSLTGPDKDNYDSEEDYREARASYAEDKATARKAVSALVQAVLASDFRSRLEDDLHGRVAARRLAEILYASVGAEDYAEPEIWTHPGTGEVQVSFDLADTTHVIIGVSLLPSWGARVLVTANRLGDEDDPGLGRVVEHIRTLQQWEQAVGIIKHEVDALARERVLA